MNDLNLDNISSESEKVLNDISDEDLDRVKRKFNEIYNKFVSGEELTLEDQKVIIEHARAVRTYKFFVKPEKPKRERKPKKLARKRMIELFQKFTAGEELSEEDSMDLKRSLEEYPGKKLSKKDFQMLLILEKQLEKEGKSLNEIDRKDKDRTLEAMMEF